MSHLEQWMEDSSRQRLVREIEPIQSEWPAHTSAVVAVAANTSGYATPTSGSLVLLLSVPSSRWFKWRTMVIDNETLVTNFIDFYTGAAVANPAGATQSVFAMHIGPRETEFIAMDNITCGQDLYANASTGNCHIRVGGLLIQSGPEYGQE